MREQPTPLDTAAPGRIPVRHDVLFFGVKAVHSAALFVIQSAIVYLLYKGLRGQSDKSAAAAAAIACGESAIYAANGFRCPLTGLAEDLGAEHGQVTDIFLPKWLTDNIANIYVPLLAAGLLLHARNLRGRSSLDEAAPSDL